MITNEMLQKPWSFLSIQMKTGRTIMVPKEEAKLEIQSSQITEARLVATFEGVDLQTNAGGKMRGSVVEYIPFENIETFAFITEKPQEPKSAIIRTLGPVGEA
jgi:hypothetical protein